MEDDQDQTIAIASALMRHRSPTFSTEEVKALINIVERYKTIVFNKSTSAAASHAKEATWIKIAKVFNRQGFSYVRSVDSLKMKWDNLKRKARQTSKNLLDTKYCDLDDDIISQMVAMMCEAENNTRAIDSPPTESDGDLNETAELKEPSNNLHWNSDADKDSEDSMDGDESRRIVNRSQNFTPKECNLLLQCVRREKNVVFMKSSTANAIKLKNKAWSRITHSYNKLSPQKRKAKVLRTKFMNMKQMTKDVVCLKNYVKGFCKKRQKLGDPSDSSNEVKSEPVFEGYSGEQMDDLEDGDIHDIDLETNNYFNSTIDPLHTVLKSDCGLDTFDQSENKEIIKLKTDLLNIKMETAKLHRKRIEDLIQADAVEREAKAIETSLRLRAARLEAVAAEMKLPPTHPDLIYTVEESRAQHYMHQYHNT